MKSQSLEKLLKGFQVVLMLLLVLSASSCKTTRTATKEATKSDFVDLQISNSQTFKKDSAKSVVLVTDNTVTADSSVIKAIVTFFNPPDSTGKQSINKVVESTTNNWSKKNNDVKTSAVNSSNTNLQINDSKKSDYKSDTQTTIDQRTKTTISPPAFLYAILAMFAVILIIVAYAILQHYDIIKW